MERFTKITKAPIGDWNLQYWHPFLLGRVTLRFDLNAPVWGVNPDEFMVVWIEKPYSIEKELSFSDYEYSLDVKGIYIPPARKWEPFASGIGKNFTTGEEFLTIQAGVLIPGQSITYEDNSYVIAKEIVFLPPEKLEEMFDKPKIYPSYEEGYNKLRQLIKIFPWEEA